LHVAITCYVNRVKQLNKDVARRALKRAVVNNASTTCSAIDSARSRRSVTPPSLSCHASPSYSLDNDVLPTAPRNDLATQLCAVLAHCSSCNSAPSETVQFVSDDQTMPDVSRLSSNDGLSTDRGAWFLPLNDSCSPRRQKASRQRVSTLVNIDESLDESVVYNRHPVIFRQQAQSTVPQPIIAWASDVECDDEDGVAAEKQERNIHAAGSTVPAVSDIQTHLTSTASTGKRESSKRSASSDPAVSLDQHRATSSDRYTPMAGGVQSDFVLSSTNRSATAVCPREAVCKMRAEGDHTNNVNCPSSSTVSYGLGHCGLHAGMPGDHCQLQSSAEVSSKLKNILSVLPVGGLDNECLATNNNQTCCRIEQVVQGNSRCRETTRDTNKVMDHETLRPTADTPGRLQTLQNTNNSSDSPSAMHEKAKTMSTSDNRQPQPRTESRRQSDSKQVHDATELTISRSHEADRQQPFIDTNSVSNNKSCWSSSPNNMKLFAELINKISELATRQDHLERITPTSRLAMAEKSCQTDYESSILPVSSTSMPKPSNERVLKQSKKQRRVSEHSGESHTPKQKVNSQTVNSNVPETKQAIHATPTNDNATASTKLTNSSLSSRQHDNTGVAVKQQQPPALFVEPSPSSTVTDNIIHMVRGSSALDDLTVEELVRQYNEPCRVSDEPAAHYYQPAVQTKALTETHSQPLDQASVQSESLGNNGLPRLYQGPKIPQDDRQHSPRDISNDSQQRLDPQATQFDRQVSPRPRHDRETPQNADSVSLQPRRDRSTTQDNPQYSPRPHRESKTSSLRRFVLPANEQHRAAESDKRSATERHEHTWTSHRTSVKTTDDRANLKMQYVLRHGVFRIYSRRRESRE